ncbi:hypothetical protein JUJ52_22830, partial [Virgibacillus sp. AGTR]|uniref:hypothetical protein n=1 Tax=Virgibacillus sp. AGTR TaxID=2812055 RepID=UPI001D16DF96
MLNISRGIFLILGYAIIILIVSTIWTEFNIRPPESGPLPVGILHKMGIEIRYALLIGLFCFIISIILT